MFHARKKLTNSQLFEKLNDADITSMPASATSNVKTERIILCKRNRESAFVFRPRVAKFFDDGSVRIKCEKSLYWPVTNVCVWLVKNLYLYICNYFEGHRVVSVFFK